MSMERNVNDWSAAMSTGRVPVRYAGGPESAKAANALRQVQANRDNWPYPHVYPPDVSERRGPNGYIAMPNPGTPTLVFQYKVPSGLQFEMLAVMFAAVTTGMIVIGNPGDVSFTVNRNTPATGTAPQGSPLADLQLVPFNYGSPIQGPVQLLRAENFQGTDIVSLYCTNNNLTAGAPNFVVGLFQGWQRPA